MQIVIDIEPYALEHCKRHVREHYATSIEEVIANGTPLPESHGDLIDRQSLINNGIEKGFCDWYDEIKYAPTIIEADKGE